MIDCSPVCPVSRYRSISINGGDTRLITHQKKRKDQKTVLLLVWSIVIVILAWLPLNILNVLLDLGLYTKLFRYAQNSD